MKYTRYIAAGMAAASLAAAPALAQPAERASAPAKNTNGMESGGIIAIVGVIAVVALGVIAATNGDDTPVSP